MNSFGMADRSRNPLNNNEPLDFDNNRMAGPMNMMGVQMGSNDQMPVMRGGFHSNGGGLAMAPPPPPPIQGNDFNNSNSGMMEYQQAPPVFDMNAMPMGTMPHDGNGMGMAVQYNFLPAGMQQPVFPQLPGTWMPDGTFMPMKEVIKCADCVLYPPNPNARPPVTRERPLGCRTLFIGGLPENITVDILRDVFQRCGEISSLRLSKKNFAHIRYELEVYVEYGIMLSGYRVRINDEQDAPNTGRLHCDYAQARDDTYEYECQQRSMQREMRHRQRQLADMNRPPSPPPVCHYSHHEANQLMENIKDENNFAEAAGILKAWLDRGDCNKRTVGNFYSMIQSTNSHVRRLMNELTQIDDDIRRAKEQGRVRQQQLIVQFGTIERVFRAACQQKVWDHLSKPQRKNIEIWKKQALEIKKMQVEELSKGDDEMDLSDDDEPKSNKRRKAADSDDDPDEKDNLRSQLDAYRNEVEFVRLEHREELDSKQKQMDIMKKTLQNVQQQLLLAKSHERTMEKQLTILKRKKPAVFAPKDTGDGEKKDAGGDGKSEDAEASTEAKTNVTAEDVDVEDEDLLSAEAMPADEARIVGLASAFLNVHPDGASCDYIWSYLQQFSGYMMLSARQVESTLSRYGSVFRECVSGVGAKMERKWLFIGYQAAAEDQ